MLSITAVATLSAFLQPTPMLPSARTSSRGRRAVGAVAFVGDEEGIASAAISQDALLWTKTRGGLSYKDLEVGTSESVAQGDLLSVKFTTTILSTGEIVDLSDSLIIPFGSGKLPFFDEAIDGMRVGSKRRVLVLPSSAFSVIPDETVEFELEVNEKLPAWREKLYQIGGFRSIFRALVFLSFVPDVAHAVHVPLPTLVENLYGYGAAPVADAAAAAAGHIDKANAWAMQAAGLF